MKNLIVVTGGAGFVGSNLIDLLIKKTKYKIYSIDNYSTGKKKNHTSANNQPSLGRQGRSQLGRFLHAIVRALDSPPPKHRGQRACASLGCACALSWPAFHVLQNDTCHFCNIAILPFQMH